MRTQLFMQTPLPRWVEAITVQVLCETFARAFDVEAPRVWRLRIDEAGNRPDLFAFREFSAACMEEALRSPRYAAQRKERLRTLAEELGSHVRTALAPDDGELAGLVSRSYAIIGIDVEGSVPGALTFRKCYFSERYTPALCAFMSAFDDGFVSGLCGGGKLAFDTRITEGCPNCEARFERKGAGNAACFAACDQEKASAGEAACPTPLSHEEEGGIR